MDESPIRRVRGLIYFISFLTSLCSLAYQQVMALALGDITYDFVLSQSLALGAYLLGMGLGALKMEKRKDLSWNGLIRIEIGLCLLGMFSVTFAYGAEAFSLYFLNFLKPAFFAVLIVPYISAIGYLNGLEMPYLFKLRPDLPVNRIVGWNYFGALAGSIITPLFILPQLDLLGGSILLGLVNLLLAFLLIETSSRELRQRFKIAAIAVLVFLWIPFAHQFFRLHLKFIYSRLSFHSLHEIPEHWSSLKDMPDVDHRRTQYQWIDLVSNGIYSPVNPRPDFLMTLDRRPQFNSGASAIYHESMVHGGIDLLGRVPKSVLILGGGDGLLLPELIKYKELEHIDWVELDRDMLKLSSQDPRFLELNHGAFGDPRVQVHVGDAFSYIRKNRAQYDLILIDLPFPNSYDLSMLFTREFYAIVRKRLNPHGLVVLDFPIPRDEDKNKILGVFLNTVDRAGFSKPFLYGYYDPFIALSQEPRNWKFDFEKLAPRLSNMTLQNMTARDLHEFDLTSPRVNSIFFPMNFAEPRIHRGYGHTRAREREKEKKREST